MSLKELESTAGDPASKVVEWFQETFPHFFTDSIVKNRGIPKKSGAAPATKKAFEPVAKKVYGGTTTHVMLHVDNHGEFYFKCLQRGIHLSVEMSRLANATAAVHGSTWVHLVAGGETLVLNRLDLQAAFRKLKS